MKSERLLDIPTSKNQVVPVLNQGYGLKKIGGPHDDQALNDESLMPSIPEERAALKLGISGRARALLEMSEEDFN
jgi:hypothetical protein